jgi:hypothetical protein
MGYSMLFRGTGTGFVDRVEIRVDGPARPADVGATDFTIEFWLKARAVDNTATGAGCGEGPDSHDDWIQGNIVLDRDRYGNVGRDFGISISSNRVVFGVADASDDGIAICGTTVVLDDSWHHVAVQRLLTGEMEIWVDGQLDASGTGASGNVSYPNGASGAPKDPFLVVGAEKHDAGPGFPSFEGRLDELRLSTVRRYTVPFTPATTPFPVDAATAALYHLDGRQRPCVTAIMDETDRSPGQCRFGGSPAGPRYVAATAL